jgi:hypothetical protein
LQVPAGVDGVALVPDADVVELALLVVEDETGAVVEDEIGAAVEDDGVLLGGETDVLGLLGAAPQTN